jgi:hypothetical protein
MRDGTPSSERKPELGEVATVNESATKNGCQQRKVLEDPNYIPMFTVTPLMSAMFDPPTERVAPATAARRNITHRRPRDRARATGDSSPDPELLSRRPRLRSKDRRYSMEYDAIVEDCERQDWRATSARFQPQQQPAPAKSTIHLSPFWVGVDEGRHNISQNDGQQRESSYWGGSGH